MQPEYLIARPHALFQPAAGVEALNLLRPSVAALDARDESLADAELSRDVLLHPALANLRQNGCVAPVQFLHSLPLAANDAECIVGLLRFDRDKGSNGEQEPLNIGSGRNSVAEKPLVAALNPTAVFFNAPVTEPIVDCVQRRPEGVGEPQPNAALILVDLDAAFPVKEARDVAQEGIFAPVFHPYSLAQSRVAKKCEMAVPVMHWIGERIAMVEALQVRSEAA